MKKVNVAVFTALLCSILTTNAQVSEITLGVKGGANYSTLWDRLKMEGRPGHDYSFKPGFYLGGLASISISKKFKFQPELLFSRRQTGIEIGGFIGPDLNSTRYRATRIESVIDVPLIFRYHGFGKFFLEVGPQLGFLLDQHEEIEENPFDSNERSSYDYDKFDAGFVTGLGVEFSSRIAMSARYFQGLIKRDASVNSQVFSLGLEYLF